MDEKIKRLLIWASGRKAPPFTLDINPTDRCNFKCVHCWQRSFREIDSSYELSDEKLLSLIKEAVRFGVEEFEITGGGEPMMRKIVILKIMETIKKNKKFGNITTNGSLFNVEDVRRIVKMGWDRITFSLDGPDAKTNDLIRGKGTFQLVMRTINLFNRVKKETKRKLPVIKFNTVITNKNYDKIEKIIELAKKVNCSIVHFDSLTIHSKIGKKLKLKKSQMIEFYKHVKTAKKLAETFSIWTDVDLLTFDFIEKSN
ncbi:MAG: radical SAM protein, partial [Candidatus Aenigmatarchaeota archaeon]